jgi:hypothetical protein
MGRMQKVKVSCVQVPLTAKQQGTMATSLRAGTLGVTSAAAVAVEGLRKIGLLQV